MQFGIGDRRAPTTVCPPGRPIPPPVLRRPSGTSGRTTAMSLESTEKARLPLESAINLQTCMSMLQSNHVCNAALVQKS